MKKVLSFVLVLAMVLGSVSMAFAATKTYSDDASITNKEAVAVLSAAGVLEGDANGFRPTDGLTRAEGAAIAARMLLGKADAAKLTTVVGPFSDVPSTHWAAGYIAYCVSQGLINGNGDGTFSPEAPLSVAAFGKMMLTALGYKSENEGFTGSNWETNVGSVMVKANLTDGVTLSGSNAATREVAAQVALNTLKAALVDYASNGVSVNTGNATVTVGASKAEPVQSVAAGVPDGKIKADGFVQFAEKYQDKLQLAATNEAFGRPGAKKWTYDNASVYTKKSTDKLITKYTTKQTGKTVYAALDSDAAKDANYIVYVDGEQTVATTSFSALKNSTDNVVNSNGVQMEVYYDSATKLVTIVAYNYYVAKASADYNESKKTVKVDVQTGNATAAAISEIKQDDFNVAGVKENDYLIITQVAKEVKSVAPATKVAGSISTYTQDTNITVDGTKYTKAGTFKGVAFNDLSVGSDVTLVLDPNNFVVATTDETAQSQYVYIYKAATENNLDDTYHATAYFIDGTKATITLDTTDDYNLVSKGGFFNYSVKKNGNYTMSTITNATPVGNTGGVDINAGKIAYASGGAFKSANANTVFLVKKAGNTNVTVYTGYKAVPGTTNATVAAVEKDNAAKYVFVDASGALTGADTTDYVLIYKKGTVSTVKDADSTYYTYANAFLNGTKGEIQLEKANSIAVSPVGLYKDIQYSDGKIAGGNPVVGEVAGTGFAQLTGLATPAGFKFAGDVLTIGTTGYAISSDAQAYIIKGSDVDEVSVGKIDVNMDDDVTYDVYIVFTDTSITKPVVKTIFLVKQGN